jgi:hypothetical protein
VKKHQVLHSSDELGARLMGPWVPITGLAQAIGIALLPKCPFCIVSYLGAFGVSGLLGKIGSTTLFWISVASLTIAIGASLYLAIQHRRPWTFALTVMAIGLIAIGKSLSFEKEIHLGALLLVVAAIANVMLTKPSAFSRTRNCCRQE